MFAYLCKIYNFDPLKDGVIISHTEWHRKGIASGHADLEHLWNGLGVGFTYVFDSNGKVLHPVVSNTGVDYVQSFDTTKAGSYKVMPEVALHLRAGVSANKRSIEILPCGAYVQCYGYYSGT